MGIVWLAHDVKHDRRVAIKVVRPELGASLGAERFLREIRIAAHLQHPHVLTLIDSGEISAPPGGGAGLLYYVMPYIDGETLRHRLERDSSLPVTETVRLLQHVLDALAYAHRMGIVHRDMKPENVMLAEPPCPRHGLRHREGGEHRGRRGRPAGGDAHDPGTRHRDPRLHGPRTGGGDGIGGPPGRSLRRGRDGLRDAGGRPAVHRPHAPGSARRPTSPARPSHSSGFDPTYRRRWRRRSCAVSRRIPSADGETAEELSATLDQFATPQSTAAVHAGSGPSTRRWPRLATIAAVLLLAAAVLAALWAGPGRRRRSEQWAHQEGIPRLLALADRGQWDSAYTLARAVEAVDPGDSLFRAVRPKFARRANLRTSPPGAKVWAEPYEAPDSAWTLLGTTPLDSTLMPLSVTRFRIEAPGRRTLDLLYGGYGAAFRAPGDTLRLDPDTTLPADVVRVPGGDLALIYPGFEHVKPIRLGDYLVHRYETTNAEFKRFVDGGGYQRRELWPEPFVRAGRRLSWDQAMALMVDRTGRRGPATWEAGDYPAGQARYPVGGLSWYEAAAYAAFMGESLPTVVHWNTAASVYHSASIVPLSNFAGQGPAPVGASRAMSAYGTYDMAGNVREWCLNAQGDARFILGGGWNDQPYQFNDAYAQDPFDRSPTNGLFAWSRYLAADSGLTAGPRSRCSARRGISWPRAPGGRNAVFAAYRQMYEYDRTPLEPRDARAGGRRRLDPRAGPGERGVRRRQRCWSTSTCRSGGHAPTPPSSTSRLQRHSRSRARRTCSGGGIDFIIKSGRAPPVPGVQGHLSTERLPRPPMSRTSRTSIATT